MMLNTLSCHSEERSEKESLKGRAIFNLHRLKRIERIRDSLRTCPQGKLRFAQNDTSDQNVFTRYNYFKKSVMPRFAGLAGRRPASGVRAFGGPARLRRSVEIRVTNSVFIKLSGK